MTFNPFFSPKYPTQVLGKNLLNTCPLRQASGAEKKRFEPTISVVGQTESCTVYRIIKETGIGYMTTYTVYPGVTLSYNEFAMSASPNNVEFYSDMIEINHCKEGRFECSMEDGQITYLGKGDLEAHRRDICPINPSFPLGYYQGISVLIELSEIQVKLKNQLQELGIDIDALPQALNLDSGPFCIRSTDKIEHIFSEIYDIQEPSKIAYLKIKMLELLYFLYHTPSGRLFQPHHIQLPQYQVVIIKQIHEYLVQNLTKHITLKQLSKQFSIAETTLKTGFKLVYGTTIGSYLRSYRVHVAAGKLALGDSSVTEIALAVGYENPSKFAAAFKQAVGKTPREYQRKVLQEKPSPCIRCATNHVFLERKSAFLE